MLVDVKKAKTLSWHDFPSLPAVGVNVVRRFKAGDVDIILEHEPKCASGEDLTYVEHALFAIFEGNAKCCVTLEMTDLRSLASHLGVSVKSLQKEYSAHSFFVEPKLALYGNGVREAFGEVIGTMGDEDALKTLMNALLDAIDSPDEPEEVKA